jgi:perosamine synthetase
MAGREHKPIPVCEPTLLGNEKTYVLDALETGWISSAGKYVTQFEQAFAAYCGVSHGIAVCNGTVALHLALTAAGVGKGDEVIVPDFTMISSAFAVCYAGAVPVFVDAEPYTWNIDPAEIEEKITSRTKAIMPVHIYGHPCDMDEIHEIAGRHGLLVVEDAAEAHGAEYKGKRAGSFGHVNAFSFFANKNITTGEGGMVVTDDAELAEKCRYYKNLCFPLDAPRTYIHDNIGFNYRMSNLLAAIGLAQVEKADAYRSMRIRNGQIYRDHLTKVPGITTQPQKNGCLNVYWMNGIIVHPDHYGHTRDELASHLRESGIDTRNFFVGLHRQPALEKYGCPSGSNFHVTDTLARQGLYLPSSSHLTAKEIESTCDKIAAFARP